MTSKLTHKDRFLCALNHEVADKIPTYAFKAEHAFNIKYKEARMPGVKFTRKIALNFFKIKQF